jgi:hypothetical protein
LRENKGKCTKRQVCSYTIAGAKRGEVGSSRRLVCARLSFDRNIETPFPVLVTCELTPKTVVAQKFPRNFPKNNTLTKKLQKFP